MDGTTIDVISLQPDIMQNDLHNSPDRNHLLKKVVRNIPKLTRKSPIPKIRKSCPTPTKKNRNPRVLESHPALPMDSLG
jgi:hypothetical protein